MALVQSWQAPIAICNTTSGKGADVKLRDREGATALMLAADKGRNRPGQAAPRTRGED